MLQSEVARTLLRQKVHFHRLRQKNNPVNYPQLTGFDDMNALHPSSSMASIGNLQQNRPFTFDPLYVEDPLHQCNNVD